MASFKYLWHLICIGYMSFLYKVKVLFGSWELQSLARMNYHSISNKTSGHTSFISSLCCCTYRTIWTFRGTSLTLWSSPLKAHRFVDVIPTPLVISLSTSISPCHKEGTIEWPKKKKKVTDTPMQHSEKELSCFLLWKSQCNPLVFMDFHFFYSKWGWEVRPI